jgi:putative ABC transport system permease protein
MSSHTPNLWRQAWRNLWRDARAGELRLLVLAVVLGMSGLTSVGFLADRIQAGLQRDARQLLGGDVVLVSDQAPPDRMVTQAQAWGLRGVLTLSFPTMARAANDEASPRSRLVALKAVDVGYPLRGQLQVATQLTADGDAVHTQTASGIPQPGEVWVEPAVLDALGVNVGQRVMLGTQSFRVAQLLMREPDRGAGFMNFAPRVMMNRADLQATGLVQPASRVTWRYAFVGDPTHVARFQQWAETESKQPEVRGVRVESLEAGRPEMRQTLERAGKFLNLVALLATLLSAVAVGLAARSFANRHLDDCAMLRVLGVSQRHMVWMYLGEFVGVGVVAGGLGVALGYAVHGVFVQLLAGLVTTDLPPATLWPAARGMAAALTLLLAFGVPPVLQLAHVPPLRVMRRDMGEIKAGSASVWVLGLLGFAVLLVSASGDLKLGGMVVGGFVAAALLFAGLAGWAVRVLRRTVREAVAPPWLLLATRQISARPVYAMVQVGALGLGLLALFLLVLLRTDLVQSWRQATPADAPNRFVINIQPAQADAFLAYLRERDVSAFDWYPMIRGRLVAINGQTVTPEQFRDERAQRLVDREFNLSYAEQAPPHNRLVAGQWRAGEANALSLEEGIAKTLGLKVGDVLRFDMAGVQHDARVTSLRKVDWTSMRANFFVMYPVADAQTLGPVPVTFMTAFRAPPRRADAPSFDNTLLARFPNVTSVDMGATLDQVQSVLTQVTRAVEFLFGFTLAAGLVVLMAAVTATREERAREYAVLRALGATQSVLQRVQAAELLGVGALAGTLAASMALLVSWALARYVFEFEWSPLWWMPLAGAAIGALLALLAGWWGLRDVLRRPVVQTLRQARI